MYKNDPVIRKCAACFDIDREMLSQEKVIAAGKMAIMCLHNFKQHSVGKNVLRKMTFLDINVAYYVWMLRNVNLEPVKTDQDPAPTIILTTIRCGCKSGCKVWVHKWV